MFNPHLITVGLTYGSILISPFIPDMTVQEVDIIGFLLPDPEHFLRS